ncbi:unnamed protein product [Ceutorhynchus assimilis]|uniref:General transcription factor 3C polypeptide 5 n=1 Tax=Ceutorhynchus assimilis TaxID=467358 RepID=A0A9N9QN00_9CUCU|nr:unnamed protein product [Ceutorhynchus assimilis]
MDKNVEDPGPSASSKTKTFRKTKVDFFEPQESVLHEDLDTNCLYQFDKALVRIEYPGLVKNPEKAIESLGGITSIEHAAVEGKKLGLYFNPKSVYMKGCVADKDQNIGLLIKVKQGKDNQEAQYEILGITDTCFKFNRMCDFQYLPLIAKDKNENKESDVEYIYSKIVCDKIPTLEWFTKKEIANDPPFLISGNFGRFDVPHSRFSLNSIELFNSMVRRGAPQILDFGKKHTRQKIIASSIRVVLHENSEIPTEPMPGIFEVVKSRFLQYQLNAIKKLFEERPIWTKSGIMHKANINQDTAKNTLPCIAYYCHGGPWRTCWIKFGYNPVTDFNSRIYQILDFRIRQTEGMQVKIKPKKTSFHNLAPGFDLKYPNNNEVNYIIRPNQVPPARQMFYQYCDIKIPEVQEMLMKLPKLPPTAKYDQKNGWLPLSFQEHCREIVNKYIFEAVQQEILKEKKSQKTVPSPENVTAYCSQMLSNMKKGITSQNQNAEVELGSEENVIEEIDLSDDDGEDEEIDAISVMNNLPQRIPGNFDEEDDEDLDIDLEAVEEVNEIVAAVKDQQIH